MANLLSKDKQIQTIAALAEGASIRSIERMTNIHRDTIMRLGVKVGKGCARLLDQKMRGLSCRRIQVDEVWSYVGKHDRFVTPEDDADVGSVWTFCAIDSDTKIVPSYKIGKRDIETATAFMNDLASRLIIESNFRVTVSPRIRSRGNCFRCRRGLQPSRKGLLDRRRPIHSRTKISCSRICVA